MMEKRRMLLLSGILLILLPHHAALAQDCETCSFSSYLVGTVDLRDHNYTMMQIINPTSQKIYLIMGFFRHDGSATGCRQAELGPNAMFEMTILADTPETKPLTAQGGIVKIVSLDRGREKPVDGILGFQRHFFQSGIRFFSAVRITESNLATVPKKVLLDYDAKELKTILQSCRP